MRKFRIVVIFLPAEPQEDLEHCPPVGEKCDRTGCAHGLCIRNPTIRFAKDNGDEEKETDS